MLFAALVAAAPGVASGQAPGPPEGGQSLTTAPASRTIIAIPRTPPAEPAPQEPAIDPPPDFAELAGKPVTRFVVVFEGNIWDDVQAAPVSAVKTGDPFRPSTARGALEELLRSGRFARGRVTAEKDGGGVGVVVRLVPRKLIGRLDLDLHGARLDREELLRAADLSEGGEIVGADVGTTSRNIERYLSVHGYPSAKATLRMRDTDDPMRTLLLVDVTPDRRASSTSAISMCSVPSPSRSRRRRPRTGST